MSLSRKAAWAAAAVGGTTAAAGILLKVAAPDVVDDFKLIANIFSILGAYNGVTILDILELQSRTRPTKRFLIFEGQEYTFRDADEWSNRVGRLFHQLGVVKGDGVALLMRNEPAFVWLLLGLLKVGATVTLLNYNLRLQSLLHCITIARCKYVVVAKDADLLAAIGDISAELTSAKVRLLAYADASVAAAFPTFERAIADDIAQQSGAPLPPSVRVKAQPSDKACYIFTSGTTGLPKAAIFLHSRLFPRSTALVLLAGIYEDDVLYTSLPLYHSAACMFLSASLVKGCTLALGRKFGASSFWDDCRRYKVTVIQYIGEVCRYLLAVPKRPDDSHHCVRMAFGNGLRIDIWKEFKRRFNIPIIREFYAASEGTFSFINMTNTDGSCGKMATLLQLFTKVYGIQYDVDKDCIVRGPDGLCRLARPGEVALYVARLNDKLTFEGYEGDQAQSEKKILRNVFKKGDAYYNSGDLLMRDGHGNMYFVDRVGDTFRWNGENVSTIEVSNVLSKHPAIQDAIVYGVLVPGHDGRAGMAALCLQQGTKVDDLLLQSLYKHVTVYLPPYAQPYFLRFLDEPPLTGTFKYSAATLKKDGFDLSAAAAGGGRAQHSYIKSRARGTYIQMDDELLAQVGRGILDATKPTPGDRPAMSRL